MSKKIWVIEQGQYSDYGVVGVFSTRENAERVMATMTSDYDQPSIAEWDLDPGVEELRKGKSLYLVNMKRNGDVDRCIVVSAAHSTPSFAPNGRDFYGHVWAKTDKAAIKIVNDKRTQWLAQNP